MVRYRSKVKNFAFVTKLTNHFIRNEQSDQYKNPNSHNGITFFDPTSILSIA
jgi:hypothetical protein